MEKARQLRNAAIWMLLIGNLAGWGRLQADQEAAPAMESLHLAGSSSMEKLTDALAECFMEQHPDVTVTVQFTGSSAGIKSVASGAADIGNVSRDLSDEEMAAGAKAHVVALDGIAICVDPANPLTGVTKRQLADIFTGKIRSWSSLGGGDVPIVLIGREAGSGTRAAFEERLGISGQCTYANEMDSSGAVMARIAATPGAIGYVSFDTVGIGEKSDWPNSVSALALDGMKPTAENVRNGTYSLYRPFLMVTRGELADQRELVRLWFCYVFSEEGQEIVKKAGLVVLD